MKKIILFICLGFLLNVGRGQWTQVNPYPTNSFINSTAIVNVSTIFFCTETGEVFKSTNAGVNWSSARLTLYALTKIFFSDASHGWSLNNNSKIYITTNGGNSWLSYSLPYTFSDIFFINSTTGWGVASSGKVLKTTDGGINWIVQPTGITNNLRSVFFYDAFNGSAVGENGILINTTNSGATWNSIATGTVEELNGVKMLATANMVAVGDHGYIYKTINGGATHTNPVSGVTDPLYAVDFTDVSTGYISTYTAVLKTVDGGFTWNATATIPAGSYYSCDFFPGTSTGMTVSGNSEIMFTNNGGTNWIRRTSGSFSYLYDCAIVGTGAWSVGLNTILYSSDAGLNWSAQASPYSGYLTAVSFVDNQNGWIGGDNGTILKTTNGGNVWTTVNAGIPSTDLVKGIYALPGTSYVFAVTNAGRLYKTSDQGVTWTPYLLQSGIRIQDVYALNTSIWMAVANDGKLYKTTNGGTSWNAITVGLDLISVSFRTASEGWIADFTGKLFKTTDQGANWTDVTTLLPGTTSFRKVRFNGSTGYIVGSNGYVNGTIDGGLHWTDITAPNNNTFAGVGLSSNGTACVVGDNGSIFRTTNVGGLLPINLLTFSGKAENKTIELQWQTASELNNKGFELQRFEKNEWRPLTFIAGKDNSSTLTNYTYTDLRPLQGNNSYRLKQIDKDGKSNYSQVLSVKMENSNAELQLSPVPAKGFVTVSYALAMKENVQVNLININGQPVKTIVNEIQNAGSYTVNVPLTGFAKGSYYVQLLTGKKRMTKLLVVQ